MKIYIREEKQSVEEIEEMLLHIAGLLKQGYTSGFNPTWIIQETAND